MSVLDNAHPQTHSSFLQRIPAEVRNMVYGLALQVSTQVIHVTDSWEWDRDNTIAALPCKGTAGDFPCSGLLKCDNAQSSMRDLSGEMRYECCWWKVLGLIHTCRLLYSEVMPLMYSSRTFMFNSSAILGQFCDTIHLNQQFTQSPMKLIKDIRLSYPRIHFYDRLNNASDAALCNTLMMLSVEAVGLKKLVIESDEEGDIDPLPWDILEALSSFRGLRLFNLIMTKIRVYPPWLDEVYEENRSKTEEVLRCLVYKPRGVSGMDDVDFDDYFTAKYRALGECSSKTE